MNFLSDESKVYIKALVLGTSLFSISCSEQNQVELPNILLIVADDMGPDMGCYGDDIARTPNLDKLAAENVLFEKAYVTNASCSPSRSSILTGLYPHQTGQTGLSHHGFSMNQDYRNIPSVLKKVGYKTALLGKLHVKPFEAFPFDFTVSIDFPNETGLEKGFNPNPVNVIRTNGSTGREKVKFAQTVERVADSAGVFFEDLQGKPFFMMVNFLDPHHPFYDQVEGQPEKMISGKEVINSKYNEREGLSEKIAGYYNGISRVDIGFGLLEKYLQENDLYENTLIIFIGDHGPPFARSKLTCYERGLKIPFIVKFPFSKYQGRFKQEISTIDIFPTILEILNQDKQVSRPDDGLPGISLTKHIREEAEHEAIFAEFNFHGSDYIFPMRSVKKGNIKLIVNYLSAYYSDIEPQTGSDYIRRKAKDFAEKPKYELYDLKVDPEETDNLASRVDFQPALEELLHTLQAFQVATGDTLVSESGLQWFRKRIEKELIKTK